MDEAKPGAGLGIGLADIDVFDYKRHILGVSGTRFWCTHLACRCCGMRCGVGIGRLRRGFDGFLSSHNTCCFLYSRFVVLQQDGASQRRRRFPRLRREVHYGYVRAHQACLRSLKTALRV